MVKVISDSTCDLSQELLKNMILVLFRSIF